MSIPLTAPAVLDHEFLPFRAKLLELAATLDRITRADGSVADDVRIKRMGQALEVLQIAKTDRAEQIQLIFSRTYDDDWQEKFQLTPPS